MTIDLPDVTVKLQLILSPTKALAVQDIKM